MFTQTSWHGTTEEGLALIKAIEANCTCAFGVMGARLSACSTHRMLTEDQRALDGLLFARRVADRLQREEFSTSRTDRIAP